MNNTSLQKVFNLINKTGDRCIILSSDSSDAYAIMSLNEYERMALGKTEISNLTEDEFLDKINRDIAVWKSQQEKDIEEPDHEDDNLANIGKNYDWEDEESSFAEDMEDDPDEEEPFYFEKI